MQYRDYQIEGIQSIFGYFDAGNTGNPIVVMPTGTGKSLVIGGFIHSVFSFFPGQRIMVLTHVQELIEQDYNKLMEIWPTAPAGIYSAGLNRKDTMHPIIFGGIGSVVNKPFAFGCIDLILIDECQLVPAKTNTSYRIFIEKMLSINPNLKVIGFSATPYRLGSGLLIESGLFTDICFDNSKREKFNKLVSDGYLAPLVTKKTQLQYDIDGVRIQGGEFVQKELQQSVDKESLTIAAIEETISFGKDRAHWLIFTTGIDHTEHTVEILERYGVSVLPVHSKLKKKDRTANINAFKNGEVQALVNPNILTTGFDYPGIDLIASLRPTVSPGLWVQMLGRGTRPVFAPGYDLTSVDGRLTSIFNSTKQNCLVLDFAGNTKRLGPVNDPLIPKKKGKKKGEAPVRLCECCNTYLHASIKVCPECGFVFPIQEKIRAKASVEEVMVADAPPPQIELFKVTRVEYSKQSKKDRPSTLKVTYWCGLRMFNEWVCLEHDRFAGKKARDWWRGRSGSPPPKTIDEAIILLPSIAVPSQIRVWVNKQFPEVVGHDFSRAEAVNL